MKITSYTDLIDRPYAAGSGTWTPSTEGILAQIIHTRDTAATGQRMPINGPTNAPGTLVHIRGDRVRRDVVEALRQQSPLHFNGIRAIVSCSNSDLTNALAVLSRRNVIERTKIGSKNLYSIKPDT